MIQAPNISTLLIPFQETVVNGAPLRVGVVLDSKRPRPWEDALLTFLGQIRGLDVQLLIFPVNASHASKRPSWLVNCVDTASRARFDPFGPSGDFALNGDLNGEKPAGGGAADGIRNAKCEVLIWLAGEPDSGLDLKGLAPQGAFTVRFGRRHRIIPFWDEVANSEVTSSVSIAWHESSFFSGRMIAKPETATTQGFHFTLNAEEPVVAAMRTLASACLGLRSGRSVERWRTLVEEPMDALAKAGYPSNLEAGRFVAKKMAASATVRLRNRGREAKWFVAIRPNRGNSVTDPGRLDLEGFREVRLPQERREMADPFLAEHDGHTYLLFEDIPETRRGRLGCVEIFKDGSCSEMRIILERDYHISYPCVVEENGELFLLPETADAGQVELYRFREFPWEIDPMPRRMAADLRVVDTTPIHHEGRWYFFTTTAQPFMETFLFWADRLDSVWNLHPASPISVSVRNSRSAGNLFWRNGRLYRPTQDCSVCYGYAIQVNEVTRLTPTEFVESPVQSVLPTWMPGLRGTHTWNESSQYQVIDGVRF